MATNIYIVTDPRRGMRSFVEGGNTRIAINRFMRGREKYYGVASNEVIEARFEIHNIGPKRLAWEFVRVDHGDESAHTVEMLMRYYTSKMQIPNHYAQMTWADATEYRNTCRKVPDMRWALPIISLEEYREKQFRYWELVQKWMRGDF